MMHSNIGGGSDTSDPVEEKPPCNARSQFAETLEPETRSVVGATSDLAGTNMLQQMTHRLVANSTFEGTIQTMLDDTIALVGAQFGNVQLPIGDELVIAAQRGLSRHFLMTFRKVQKDDGSACGRALRLGKTVVIADVEKDAEFAGLSKRQNGPAFAPFKVRHSLRASAR
jgi:hypothetical protein